MDLFSLETLKLLGPAGFLFAFICWGLYKVFRMYADVQEKRIEEAKAMLKEYNNLSSEITSTLDTLLKVLGKKS